jgi:hypothetical protein|uniref:Uncharacterized protein n=1 Tax=viral metagenome TaxID=1070528 RepID=A0A6C0BII2_9ZZZZ
MFDKLWAWIMGIITYLAALFGLNRATTVTEQMEQKEEVPESAEPENQ